MKEEYFIVFDNTESLEAFIQQRYGYWKELLNKEIVMAPEHNETIGELSIRRVFELTAECCDVKKSDIFQKTRTTPVIEARRFAIAICVEMGQLVTNIARAIEYNHTNIIHHRNKFYDLCDTEQGYQDRFLEINDFVLTKLNQDEKV